MQAHRVQIVPQTEKAHPSDAGAAVPSIAVVPFADLSPNCDQGYFCEGIAEEILNALVRIGGLRVAPRFASFQGSLAASDIQTIGTHLRVAHVLEGSVRKEGRHLRITVRLTDVEANACVWAERYDRELDDVFAIQDEIAEHIVRSLQGVRTEGDRPVLPKVPRATVQAYEFYLRGRSFFYRQTKQDHEFAREMYSRAIEVDPAFALAYAGMSDSCLLLYKHFDHRPIYLKDADDASGKAVDLAPELGETHASRGFFYSLSGQHDAAEQEFETAIRLNPRIYETYFLYGVHQGYLNGQFEAAARLFGRAADVQSTDFQAPLLQAAFLRGAGQIENARDAYRRGLHLARRHLELNPDDVRALYLAANAMVALGEKEQGLQWIDRALALSPAPSAMLLYNVAAVYALAGEVERGIDFLEEAVRAGYMQREPIERDPDLDSLRPHPRFQALLHGLNGKESPLKLEPPRFADLTPRERDVLHLVAQGLSNDEIAERLFISSKTVRNHLTHIFSKMDVTRRAEAIVRARDAGFGRGRA